MSQSVVFYHNPMSRARIVHWMLEELGVPYTIKLLSFEKGEHKQADFLAVNPMGKIPAIVHDGTVVTESAAICTYLADVFPKAGLAPPIDDHAARGKYLRWMFFAAGCVEPALMDRMLGRPKPEQTAALGYGTYEDTVNALEQAIASGPYILGDRFSAADVYVGSQIGFGIMMAKSLEPRPSFQAYLARLAERPAYQRFNAQCEQLLAEMKSKSLGAGPPPAT
jgi:glutathione S-transferase